MKRGRRGSGAGVSAGVPEAGVRPLNTYSSGGFASTEIFDDLDDINPLELYDRVVDVAETPPSRADLICPFQFLDCEASFSDILLWKTHVFSHFRGRPCPEKATCFLCEASFT
jgi:hypothetical protein